MQLAPYDYTAGRPGDAFGLSGLADLISEARDEAPNCLLFDNGDTFQGSPLADMAADDPDTPHPMVAAMNRLGFDAATLGNHDFDFGRDTLARLLDQARFPVVLSNPAPCFALSDRVARETLIRRKITDQNGAIHDLAVGIIGLAPANSAFTDAMGQREAVACAALAEHAAASAIRLRAQGAEIVVLLYHGGPDKSGTEQLREVITAARADAVVLGHLHCTYPKPDAETRTDSCGEYGNVPAVMPGFHGSHLGVIDLTLVAGENGWSTVASHVRLRTNPGRSRNPVSMEARDVLSLWQKAHRSAVRKLDQPLATVDAPVHSFFALRRCSPASRLVAQAKLDHVDTLLAGTEWETLPRLAAKSLHKVGGRGGPENFVRILDGTIRERHVHDLCPFRNRFAAVLMNGSAIESWLNDTCAIYNTLGSNAALVPLIRADARAYAFDAILGLTYDIDLSGPAPHVKNVRHVGKPVAANDRFVVATTDFKAPHMPGATLLPLGPSPFVHDILRDWLRSRERIAVQGTQPVWTLAGCQGQRAWIDTHPDAASYLSELSGAEPRIEGHRPDGFLRVSFDL